MKIKQAGADGKAALEEEKKEHLGTAKEVQQLMKRMANEKDDHHLNICIDLQQMLPILRMNTNSTYYSMKLWMYNLCIHDLRAKKSEFFVWDENNGGRGSVEVGSCILKYLDSKLENAEVNYSVLNVISDNCGGQNKNINLISLYLREIHRGRFQEINHYYLVPGHTYMACDRAFGNIEKSIRSAGNIYDFQGYVRAIRCSTVIPPKVVAMRGEDFLDLGVMTDHITHRKPEKPLLFKEARRFCLRSSYR